MLMYMSVCICVHECTHRGQERALDLQMVVSRTRVFYRVLLAS